MGGGGGGGTWLTPVDAELRLSGLSFADWI